MPQRERILREEHSEDQRVPAVRLAVLHRSQVALHEPLVAERAELAELATAHRRAGSAELAEPSVHSERTVERDKFAEFAPGRVAMRGEDGGEFDGQEDLLTIASEEAPERRLVMNGFQRQRGGGEGDCW